MDFNEFEQHNTNHNTEIEYSDDIEFVIKELNSIASASGRYSRNVQIRIAKSIVNKLKQPNSEADEDKRNLLISFLKKYKKVDTLSDYNLMWIDNFIWKNG